MMISSGVTRCCHYVDDMFTCAPLGNNECQNHKNVMLQTCDHSGFELNPKKVIGATSKFEFLGIILDSVKQELSMSKERLLAIHAELLSWRGKLSGTQRQLLSLLLKLICCQ